MKNKTVLCVLLGMALAAAPALAQSCSPVTVISITPNDYSLKIHESVALGQTFQAPVSDCLVQVTLAVCKSGGPGSDQRSDVVPVNDLVVELRNAVTVGGEVVPDLAGPPLASASIAPSSVSASCLNGRTIRVGAVNALLSTQAPLAAGTMYSLVFRQAAAGGSGRQYYRLGVQKPGSYSTGQFCNYDAANWDCPQSNGSLDTALGICVAACCTGCTYTQGYWKNHPEAWPVEELALGLINYTKQQLLDILHTAPRGNGLVILAHQLIAAKLNLANGACEPPVIVQAIADSDSLIGGLGIPPIGDGVLDSSATSDLTVVLDSYNSGCLQNGPPHCGSEAPALCPARREGGPFGPGLPGL